MSLHRVDTTSSYLRLFVDYWDIPECTQPRIFRKTFQDFGDLPAASGLEIVILNFVVPIAKHEVTKYILESIRYSDNIMYSFKTVEEFKAVKEDLIATLDKYFMSLKYCISSKQVDPQVLNHPKRGPEIVEKTTGLLWDVVEETITAVLRYNLFGESRGKQQGPNKSTVTVGPN